MIERVRQLWSLLPLRVKFASILIVLGGLLLLVIVARIDSCRTRQQERKVKQIETNLIRGNVEIEAAVNKLTEAKANAEKANTVVNSEFDRDSSTRDSNFSTVRERWCREHPNDSKCRQ
jgi:hypothetical protein